MPANIAPPNHSISARSIPANTKAGPGQIPAKPQPMPNKALPASNQRSMRVVAGS